MKEAINVLNKMINIKKYESYMEDYEKSIDLKKSTKIKLSIACIMLVIATINGILIFKEPEPYGMLLFTINSLIPIGLFANTMSEVEAKTKIIGTSLSKQDFLVKEIKSKSLSFKQIKLLNKFILIIKNEVGSKEFEELLLRNEKLSEVDTNNAYFYYYLFNNYKNIIKEIKDDNNRRNHVSKKINILIDESSNKKNNEEILLNRL